MEDVNTDLVQKKCWGEAPGVVCLDVDVSAGGKIPNTDETGPFGPS